MAMTLFSTNMTLDFDQDGFLTDPKQWNETIAKEIAQKDGLGQLNQAHFSIIQYLREHHLKYGSLPVMKHVCRVNHLGEHCVTELFHSPREAWRVSGLPNPGEEAKTYM